MPSLLDLALAYTKAGISIIPILPNEADRPNGAADTPFDCSEYVSRRIATPDELREWFAGDTPFGLAAVHGLISGGLECLDLTYAAVVKLFRQLVTLQRGEGLLERLPAAEATVQGRTRLYYRCPNSASGDRRLAQFELPSEPGITTLQLLALVHGEGSWTVLPGSPAPCEAPSSTYEWFGGDLTKVPMLTADQRQLLLESASCLNAWVDPNAILAPAIPDGFDSRVAWDQILLPLGWRKVKDFGEVTLWHTPERTKSGYCALSGIGLNHDLLYLLGSEEAYTKFAAFASFYFDGDVERAKSARLRSAPRSCWDTAVGTRYWRAVRKAQPLVSCIMPTTGDRRRFLPQAIKCFQRQTYPNLELVIVCDGEDNLCDLIPRDDNRVRYSYLGPQRRSIGSKRNLACERTKGDLIAHFDDDDWSHPDRLSFQVGALLTEGAELCAMSRLLFFEISTGAVWLCRTPALLHPSLYYCPFGASYLYWRSYWSSAPFPNMPRDSDMAFTAAKSRQDHSVFASDYRLYVAMIHNSNMAHYSEKSTYWSSWPGNIREVMGADLDFYLSLRQG